MRVLTTGIKRGNTVAATYKITPLTKDLVQYVTNALAQISPDINVGYSQVIEDVIQHAVESNEIFYQVDKTQYTLKGLLIKHLIEKEQEIRGFINESMSSYIESVIADHEESFLGDWEIEFEEDKEENEEEDEENEFDEFKQSKIEEYTSSDEFFEDLFITVKEDIESNFGVVFDIIEMIDSEWYLSFCNFIEATINAGILSVDDNLIFVAKSVLQDVQFEEVHMGTSLSNPSLFARFLDKIKPNYVDYWLLEKKITKEYGADIFRNSEIDLKHLILTEALMDANLSKIIKLARFKKQSI